ncbi:uncharacterized protein LOC131206324 [Anopheles bellator]|uniref:uncharacterized protein LOC131206324 n=1 Tax=Anopheles bellator TaxID=139047 RepID=UPI0026498B18|nr:uncharacterized protein LOC131206324 [Anopheles bellator]
MLKWTVTKRSDANDRGSLPPKQRRHSLRSVETLAADRHLGATSATGRATTHYKARARRSLGHAVHANYDKENQCITSTPHPLTGRLTASPYAMVLRDVSNITPNGTTPSRATPSSRKRSLQDASMLSPESKLATGGKKVATDVHESYASTLPTFDIEYSPCGVKNVPFLALRGLGVSEFPDRKPGRYFEAEGADHGHGPAAKRVKAGESGATFGLPEPRSLEEPCVTPLSSRLSELRFNKMSQTKKRINISLSSASVALEEHDSSPNSSEMGDITLDKMIDAILESAKKDTRWIRHGPKRSSSVKSKQSHAASPTYTPAYDPAADLYPAEQHTRPKRHGAKETTIILEESGGHVNEREVKTPEVRPVGRHSLGGKLVIAASPLEAACHLRRQKAVRRKAKNEVACEPPPLASLTTPPVLLCSRSTMDQMVLLQTPVGRQSPLPPARQPQPQQQHQLQEEALSTATTTSLRSVFLQGTSTPTRLGPGRKCLAFSPASSEDSLETRRSSTSRCSGRVDPGAVIANVPGVLELRVAFESSRRLQVHVVRCRDLQRATVGSINAYVKVALVGATHHPPHSDQGFQRTAVHRNSSNPQFDHRFFFDTVPDDECRVQLAVWHRDRDSKRSEFLGCISFPVKNATKQDIEGSYRLQPQACLTNPTAPIADTMCDNSRSSADDIVSMENTSSSTTMATTMSAATGPAVSETGAAPEQISLSKKALHQRDADENLFLRFLELDPSPDATATSGSVSGLPVPATPRRSSVCSGKPANSAGRTPFTITKRLARSGDRGFGFSIVWTHPPRVEKIEQGLSADKAGILPGDYVVFVEKHNVVTMPEQDVLNLIRTQGNTLLLEIFRRPQQIPGQTPARIGNGLRQSTAPDMLGNTTSALVTGSRNLINLTQCSVATKNAPDDPDSSLKANPFSVARSSTACSNISIETAKRKLHLPQVTFSKESIVHQFPDHRRKFLYQLISREQHFINAINFGIERFVNPLRERKDLISSNDHKTLFQNIDELSRISEDILEQVVQDETELQIHFASRVYLSKSTALCAAYRKYCNGLKKADCVLVNKSRNSNCDFMKFITEPPVPRKRPDLTSFIHRPLQHFRELLKLVQMIASHCRVDSEEQNNFNSIIGELQISYREITVGGGLMEPVGEGRPLLTLQDLEARMVFTKCKPFQLASHGRQWIFGGDLSRVEGRSVKPYWTLLFSDILLFAKVSRDRVLFITEEPISLSTITDSCFNIRKKNTEFRITIDPNGRQIESPTVHCAPDLTRTPKKNSKKRYIILRAPSTELKAVWQNLLTRQIFLVNATLGSTPLSSPLDSPDILQSLVPAIDIGPTSSSMASVKVPSLDNLHLKNPQPRLIRVSRQVEELIDEKCRKLNKTGVPQGSALHLAQWMKGQLDKQVIESDPIDSDPEQNIEEWSAEQVTNRSKELNLVDSNGTVQMLAANSNGNEESAGDPQPPADDSSTFEEGDDNKSVSKSTTSDSQITVRSSPLSNKVDTISVCRQCHKTCKNRLSSLSNNSLTVQHSQSTVTNRCCVSTSTTDSSLNKSPNYSSSISSSSTLTTHGESEGQDQSAPKQTATSPDATPNLDAAKEPQKLKRSLQLTSKGYRAMCRTACNCKCTPKDFEKSTLSPDELLHEQVKILQSISEVNGNSVTVHGKIETHKMNGRLPNSTTGHVEAAADVTDDANADDWALMELIGLAQINSAASLAGLDPFEALPTIAVVPPTPDLVGQQFVQLSPWPCEKGRQQLKLDMGAPRSADDVSDEYSPDNSPEDEVNEPPYRALNAGLKRYGTISSLERVPSEDTDDNLPTYNSSEEDSESDIKIVTKEVYDSNAQTIFNWTTRAGNFIEESRAFIDRYLGHATARSANNAEDGDVNKSGAEGHSRDKTIGSGGGGDEEEMIEAETSATSGEEVWGTPTSGGENDDLQLFGSIEPTHSSPTKSSSSYTYDDDTELMMDELLMAPPMTASAVRGLLPRRKLEPLFEEETESYESDDDSKPLSGRDNQGQATERNRPAYADLRGSTGSGSVSTTPSSTPQVEPSEAIKTTTPDENYGSAADRCYASVQLPSSRTHCANGTGRSTDRTDLLIGLSPRQEMRLALSHDILGDDDLRTYSAPGPDLMALLGRDLSTYRPASGKEIIMNRIVTHVSSYSSNIQVVANASPKPTEPRMEQPHTSAITDSPLPTLRNETSSSYQQNNSKMDTPTPNRRKAIAQATWNSFGYVDRDEKTLSDLERLARREKIYCMTQLNPTSSTHLKHTASFNSKSKHSSRLFHFLSRRNSENQLVRLLSTKDSTSHDGSTCTSDSTRQGSTRKESDKPLDRRFWKQLSRRRRASFHEVSS